MTGATDSYAATLFGMQATTWLKPRRPKWAWDAATLCSASVINVGAKRRGDGELAAAPEKSFMVRTLYDFSIF
jgi:hypothetical protein